LIGRHGIIPTKPAANSIAGDRRALKVMEWMPPPGGIAMCQAGDLQIAREGRHP
jgi:hypothetical protein